jgi:hypothetical protein
MANDNVQAPAGTSLCVNSKGEKIFVKDLIIPANRIWNFVEQYRATWFEEHSLEWALDEMLTSGEREIKRKVKTGEKREREVLAGKAIESLKLTPEQMVKEFMRLKALEAEAKANAAKK